MTGSGGADESNLAPLTRSSRPRRARSRLRRARWVALGLALAAIVAAAALPALIASRVTDRELAALLHERGGAALSWRGEPELSVFPTLGITIGGVTLLDRQGSQPVIVAAPRVEIGFATLPLLWGRLEIDSVELSDGRFAVDGRTFRVHAALEDPWRVFAASGTRGRITASLWPAGSAERFDVSGTFRVDAGRDGRLIDTLQISDATFQLGDTVANGTVALSGAGSRPRIEGSLAFEELDLAPYLQAWLPDSLSELLARPVTARWLELADVDLALSADGVNLGAARIGAARASLEVEDRRLTLSVPHAVFAGGDLQALVQAVPAGSGISATASGRIREVSLAEAGAGLERARTSTLIGVEQRPQGSGTGSFDVAARGSTVGALARSLSGWAVADVRDGSIDGANAVATLERVADGEAGIAEGHAPFIPIAGRTHFSRLSARVHTGNGLATLERLRLEGERLEILLSGELDLIRGEVFAEGSARLFDATAGSGVHVLVELPFGVGGTVHDPMGAPGIPRLPAADNRTAQHQPPAPRRTARGDGGPDVG